MYIYIGTEDSQKLEEVLHECPPNNFNNENNWQFII